MSRPEFALRGTGERDGDIVFRDGKGGETFVSLYELLLLIGEAALIAQILSCPSKPEKVVPFTRRPLS